MEIGDLVAYEFVTPGGDWSWSLGTVEDCSRSCLVDISQWTDKTSGTLHGRDAKEYFESLREAEECEQAGRKLGDEVRAMREKIMKQREEAEDNARRARERLLAAQEDVRMINAGDIREMRSYRTPPTLVKETLAAVLCLLRQSPVPETWENVQRVVRNRDFINDVLGLDPENEDTELNRTVMSHYLSNPAMTVENVNLASRAAGPLLKWLSAKIGATTALVELRTFDKEVHMASMQFKRKSEHISLLQQKAAAAQKNAAELRNRAAQSHLSFRRVPKRQPSTGGAPPMGGGGDDDGTSEWTKDTSPASRLTILSTSILCNFGTEQGSKRVLSQDERDMIAEAHQAARRDNSERLAFALESLAMREQEVQQLQEQVRGTHVQKEELRRLLEEERLRSEANAQLARDETAASERIHAAYRDEVTTSKAAQQRARQAEQALYDLQSRHDAFIQSSDEKVELLSKERDALLADLRALKEDVLQTRSIGSEVQHENELLQASLATEKETTAKEIRTLTADRTELLAQVAELQVSLDVEKETVRQLRSSIEQDQVGFMDDSVRREAAWSSERKKLETHIDELVRRNEELASQQEQTNEVHARSAAEHQAASLEVQERLLRLTHALEDTQGALSLAEAQNIRFADELDAQNKEHTRELRRLHDQLEESDAARQDLESRLSHEEATTSETSRTTTVLKQRIEEAHSAYQQEIQELQALNAASTEAKQEEVDQLRVSLEEMREKHHSASQVVAELESERDDLSTSLEALRQQMESTCTQLESTKQQLLTVTTERETTQQDLERVQNEVSTLRAELENTVRELHGVTTENETLKATVSASSLELECARGALQNTADENAKETLRLRQDLLQCGELVTALRKEIDQSKSRELQSQSRLEIAAAEKALMAREMEALSERSRIEVESLQSHIDDLRATAMEVRNEEAASSDQEYRNAADRAKELEEMQSRLERELQYMQSVHGSIVSQHVQLERELRSHVEGLMKETEQLRGQLRSAEMKAKEAQHLLDDSSENVRGLSIRLSAAEEQNSKLLQALHETERQRSDAHVQLEGLSDALQTAKNHAAELQLLSDKQAMALEALDRAQDAAEAMEEERRGELETLLFERDELLEELRAVNAARDSQKELMDRRVQDEQEQQRDLQREIDTLSEKLLQSNRSRVDSSNELAHAVERLQQEKRDAVEDLMRQLEASWEGEEDCRRKLRVVTMEKDSLALAAEHKDGEIEELQGLRQQEARERQARLEELVNLHREQLSALRKERDIVIRELHAEELNRSDMEFTMAEMKSRLARYEPSDVDGGETGLNGRPQSIEQTQIDELRSRLNTLQRDMDRDSQLLREKDNQLRDMTRRVVEYELLAQEQDVRRTETAAALRDRDATLRERELVLERERLLRADRDKAHRIEMEELQQRVHSLEAANSDTGSKSAPPSKGPGQRKVAVAGAVNRIRESPAPLNPASLHHHNNLSSGWYHAGQMTPSSAAASTSRKDPNGDLLTGAHLVVMIRKVSDLEHHGKPIKGDEVFAKLKTIKEKHRSKAKVLRNSAGDIDEQFVFHLANPKQDVVHIAIFVRSTGSLFDNELHVGDVDVSMATLSKSVARGRIYTIVQDARTRKARPAGRIEIVLRTDDFGSPTPPTTAAAASEELRYKAMFETFAVDHPEKLHAIDVYMAGEAAAIEEAAKKPR